MDESTGLVDVCQKRPRVHVSGQLTLGSVVLSGAAQCPTQISKASIALMRYEAKGTGKTDVTL
jgi:hypothetical protein